jgi:triphosphoribosyl-dephospho-CoA synthetase
MGKEKALEVSANARAIRELGLKTPKGKQRLQEFDRKLRLKGNSCNPGTTADLTAAALALATLSGYRP